MLCRRQAAVHSTDLQELGYFLDDHRLQVTLGQQQAFLVLLNTAIPDGILVLNRQHVVIPYLDQGSQEARPINLAIAGQAVAPPAHKRSIGL